MIIIGEQAGIFYSIAVDGPAGAGKTTISKRIAEILKIEHIDTGAMYRALTLKALELGIDPENSHKVIELLKDTEIDFIDNNIYLDGRNVNKEIRENRISKNVSYIAAIEEVREKMVVLQQAMAKSKNVIMDGRDICTVVLPGADYKFFITATVEERARRRHKELIEKGQIGIDLDVIEDEIKRRDYIDSNREVSPLRKEEDSILIDNTNKSAEESVNEMISVIKGR